MASAAAARVESIGRAYGCEHDEGITFEEALAYTQPLKLSPRLPTPIVVNRLEGKASISDMPITEDYGLKLHQWVDLVYPYAHNPDLNALEALFMANNYKDLPADIKLKGECPIPYTMQVFIVPRPDGTKSLLKLITLDKDHRMLVEHIKKLSHGTVSKIDYGKHYQNGSKAVQYQMENLPGFQVRYFALSPTGARGKATDPTSKQLGYDFIERQGPKTNIDNKATVFADLQTSDPTSPIYGWSAGLVERSCLNYGKSLAACRKETLKAITLKDQCGWFLDDVLAPCIGNFRTEAFTLIGESGHGKSPTAKNMGSVFSEWHIDNEQLDMVNGYRVCSSFEHLRHEPGCKEVSEVYDDGDLAEQDPPKVKAFNDNGDGDQRTVEKYTTTFFASGSGRLTCNNPYDLSALPKVKDMDRLRPQATSEQFLAAIRPSYHQSMSPKNMMAILKRTNYMLFTPYGVFMRKATQEEVPVPFIPHPFKGKTDLLTAECKPRYGAWKLNKQTPEPDSYKEDMAWSLAWLKVCMTGVRPPRTWTTRGPTLLSDEVVVQERKPTLAQLMSILESSVPASLRPSAGSSNDRLMVRATVSPLARPSAGSSNDHLSSSAGEPGVGSAASSCGCTMEDRMEVQKILWAAARDASGSVVDLSSPRKFCGEGPEDELAIQEILWASAKEANGVEIDLSSPGPSKKKSKTSAEADAESEDEENVFGFPTSFDEM